MSEICCVMFSFKRRLQTLQILQHTIVQYIAILALYLKEESRYSTGLNIF